MPDNVVEIPQSIVDRYNITLLGQPFAELANEMGFTFIRKGYIYHGIKYYIDK
jgi:hypothetical protein